MPREDDREARTAHRLHPSGKARSFPGDRLAFVPHPTNPRRTYCNIPPFR